MYVCILYTYIYNNFVIKLYIYNRNSTYMYTTELCQQVFIYNDKA